MSHLSLTERVPAHHRRGVLACEPYGIVRVNISSDDGSGLSAASTIGCWFVGTVRQLRVDGLTSELV